MGERGVVTTDFSEVQRLIRKYFKNVYANKLEKPEEMDKFPCKHDPLKLTPRNKEPKQIHNKHETKPNQNLHTKKSPGLDGFTVKF